MFTSNNGLAISPAADTNFVHWLRFIHRLAILIQLKSKQANISVIALLESKRDVLATFAGIN